MRFAACLQRLSRVQRPSNPDLICFSGSACRLLTVGSFFQRQIVKRIFRRLVDDDVALMRLPIIQQLCLNFSCSCVIVRNVSIYDILIVNVGHMSLEEIRENTIRLVTNNALNCFIKKGINKTTLSEIAAVSGLTERSIYLY